MALRVPEPKPQNRQFVVLKRTPVHLKSALGNFKAIWKWADEEKKNGATGFLDKVFDNISKHPENQKFRDLNLTKIRKLTKKWEIKPMLILYNAGFQEDILRGGRMDLKPGEFGQFAEVRDLFYNCKLFDPNVEPKRVIPKPKPKPEPEKMEVEESAEKKAEVVNESMEVEKTEVSAESAELTEEEKKEKEDLKKEIVMAGLDDDDDVDDFMKQMKARKAADGIETLKMSDLKGLSKEEKNAHINDLRMKNRAARAKREQEEASIKAAKERKSVKAQGDMKRQREEHQNKMLIEQKKRQKDRDKRRKATAREKIRKQKEQRKLDNERRRKEKEQAKEQAKEQKD